MATTDKISDYVSIDGVLILKDTLLKMARSTGNPVIAEHYLLALAYHAAIHNRQDIIDEVEEIRKRYNFAPLPTAKTATSSGKYAPDFSTMTPPEVRARAIYKKLTKENKIKVLRSALTALRVENERLFKNKSSWIGVYFVVRDRLDSKISQTDFYEFADSFTPEDWPDGLKIGSSTMSNLTRKVKYEDRSEAYYDMANNPWEELCEKYWALVLNGLFDEGMTKTSLF